MKTALAALTLTAAALAGCEVDLEARNRPAVRSPDGNTSPLGEVTSDTPGGVGVPILDVRTGQRDTPPSVRTIGDNVRDTVNAGATTGPAPAPAPAPDVTERRGTIDLTPRGTRPPEPK